MPSDVTREEFEGRVGVLEREVEGEKMVTRHILEQARHNSDDLAAIKTRLDRVETRLDGVDNRLGGVETRLGSVENQTTGIGHKLDGLIRELPKMIGDVMREVLREQKGKS